MNQNQPITKHEPTKYLKGAEQMELIRRIAFFEPWEDVQGWLKSIGRSLSRRQFNKYQSDPKWQPTIARMRETFNQELLDIDIANKRMRILRLREIERQCFTQRKYGLSIQALEKVRVEMEGERPTNFNQYNFSHLSISEIDEKEKELIDLIKERKKLIVSEGLLTEDSDDLKS